MNIFILYLCNAMKKMCIQIFMILLITAFTQSVFAQCSICTKTAQQLGEGPAQGLNTGIMYLMFTPFILVGFIGYRWYKTNKDAEE